MDTLRGLGAAWRRHRLSALIFLGLLALFEWASPALGVPAFILPRPSAVLAQMLAPEARLLYHTGFTALSALAGFAAGAAVGVAGAILFVHAPAVERALYPWVIVSQTVPLVVLAPLLVFWFGSGPAPRVVLAALFAFFPVLVSARRGLADITREEHDLLRAYDASPWQVLWLLRWPSSLPALFGGLKIAAALAVIGAITGELAGAGEGLGFAVTVAAYRLETARTFGAVVAAALLGLAIHLALTVAEARVVFWRR